MRSLRRIADALLLVGAVAGSISILLIALIVFYDVVMRFLGRPTMWALEISTYLMVGSAVLASGLAVVENAHFAVRLLPDALGRRAARRLDLIINGACALLLLFVCYGFYELLALSIRLDMVSPTMLRIPLWIPQAAIFAGFALMAVGFLRKMAVREEGGR